MSRYIRAPNNIKSGSFRNINNPVNDLLREPRYHSSGYREQVSNDTVKIDKLRFNLKSIEKSNTDVDNEVVHIKSEIDTIAQRNRGFEKLTGFQKAEANSIKRENAKNKPLGNERSYSGLYTAGYRRSDQAKAGEK